MSHNEMINTETGELMNSEFVSGSGTPAIFDMEMFNHMDRVAAVMASGAATVPNHLKGNHGDCMAITMQAFTWGMNPWAVAQKTHLVSGTLGYEAQLVNAVVSTSKAIDGSFHYDWYGPWENVIGKFKVGKNQNGKEYHQPDWSLRDEVGCGIRVSALLTGESEMRVLDLQLSQAQVRNSTLWASDPKQQLAYLAVKRWARLFCPSVMLGVYTPDELSSGNERELNPRPAPKKEAAVEYVKKADDNLFTELADKIESTTSIEDLNALKGDLGSAKGKLNDKQIKTLGAIFNEQGKFITNAAREAAAAAAESDAAAEQDEV